MQETPHLPDEIWERIFACLFPIGQDLRNVRKCCKRFRRIVFELKQRQAELENNTRFSSYFIDFIYSVSYNFFPATFPIVVAIMKSIIKSLIMQNPKSYNYRKRFQKILLF